jgi:multiple sugar transport system permease protein
MGSSGLYSHHVNNKKVLYLRNTILVLLLLTLAVACLFPLMYMIMNSFGPSNEGTEGSRSILPVSWSLDSYKAFFGFSEYSIKWLFNSLVAAVSQVVGNVIFASMAGYAFAKLQFKGKKFLFYMILIGMMIPYQVTQVPLYILIVNSFRLSNTYLGLVMPGLVTAYNIFLTKQFFTSVPTALIESAKLDGCSQPGVFVHIILPLSKTILAVLAINTFLLSWNTFFWPFLATSQESMYTIQVGLKQFKFANTTLFGPMMAGATVSAVPMFILFFCLQKYFLEGVTVGAVKG